ncbi:PUG domain containing protein, partial [Parasponia andersonii]
NGCSESEREFSWRTRSNGISGNTSIEDAVNWIVEHENDPDIDQMPLVTVDIDIDSIEPLHVTEEMKRKAQELRDRACKKVEEEEKRMGREREKERIRSGKELIEAKRILEENERKHYLALRQSEKEEEKRAREKIRWKLEQDKLERRGTKLQMPLKNPAPLKLSIPVVQEKQNSKLVKPVTKAELMRECLRSLKRNHMDNDARVRRAFQTLLIYVGNVARNPHEEKFRRIRLSNHLFQERVGSLKGGVEFLELCGFERTEEGEFLYLPREKVNMAVLNSTGSELKSAITNPFFGVLSRPIEESVV